MPLYGARGGFVSTADYDELERKIIDGDGLGWPGDPRMRLEIGIIEAKQGGRTLKSGHRLEVYRWNEDGSDTLVQHFHPSEAGMVCFELARSRTDSPGYVSVEDRIDKHNAEMEDKASRQFRDAMGAAIEHGAALFADTYLSGRTPTR